MKQNIITVQIHDLNINIHIRENSRSRRLSLKLHPVDNIIYLSKPPHAGHNDIVNFIEKSQGWLAKVHQDNGSQVPFKEGNHIPILGKQHLITYEYAESPRVIQRDDSLHIIGFDPIIVPGLVRDFLRSHIYQYIADTSQQFAKQIGKEIGTITIKDTKTRWGSCSHGGNLAYSWRLVHAPLSVVEYVCAHEVAHLTEMNHSPQFWRLVGSICPTYASQRLWLKVNGKTLFKYG